MIALGDIALAPAVMMGVDGEAERAEAGLDRAVEDRLDPGLVAAHVELKDFQPVRHDLAGVLDVGLGHRALKHRAAEGAGGVGNGRAGGGVEPLDAADRGERHRHGDLAAEERRAGVGAVDVAQHARTERERVQRQPITAHGGLGLGAADQIIPDVAIEPRARHGDEFMQIVELLADVVDGLERLCGRSVVHCRGHPLIGAGARVSSDVMTASKAPIKSSIWPVETRNGARPSTASAKDSTSTLSESTCS